MTQVHSPVAPPSDLAERVLRLTRMALGAPDLGSAMTPVLSELVQSTAAVGAGYFQLRDENLAFHARSASGEMPHGPHMDAVLAHGLPPDFPLIEALRQADGVLFFPDTRATPVTAGFPELGVLALTAAPVKDAHDVLVGALLSHAFVTHAWSPDEQNLIGSVTGLLTLLAARLDAQEREHAAQEGALRALGLMLEARDSETKGHTDRVTELALRIGSALGLSDADLRDLRWGAYLHDIGKVAVPDAVLSHPGALNDEAWTLMRAHVQIGEALAAQLPFLPAGARSVISGHHEHWSGRGYPRGLMGPDIPLLARIFAVCDVYDALVNVRPYKRAWNHQEALDHLLAERGQHFDERVVDALVQVLAD